MNNNNFELIVTKIKEGCLPVTTGIYFSDAQVKEIKLLLSENNKFSKKEVDSYFNDCIVPRLNKSIILPTES